VASDPKNKSDEAPPPVPEEQMKPAALGPVDPVVEPPDPPDIPARPVSPEDQAKAHLSPADLEFAPSMVGGEIKVKVNPETPTANQVAGAVGTQTGIPTSKVTITDGDGEETDVALTPDNAALITQRALSLQGHPVHQQLGHGSNPSLRELTEEESLDDQEAYAKRFKTGWKRPKDSEKAGSKA